MEIDRVLLSPALRRVDDRPGQRRAGRHVVIVAWRDIASPQAGGSELLVDQRTSLMVPTKFAPMKK